MQVMRKDCIRVKFQQLLIYLKNLEELVQDTKVPVYKKSYHYLVRFIVK